MTHLKSGWCFRFLERASGWMAASLFATGSMLAQRQPLVMAHGIRSDASTWDTDAPLLQQAFPVTVSRATTPWTVSQLSQAAVLRENLLNSLPGSPIAVGHSNGGIVLRQAALLGTSFSSLLTIGSLNLGAPAAQNVSAGSMPGIVLPLEDDFSLFFTYWRGATWTAQDYLIDEIIRANVYGFALGVVNLALGNVGFNQNAPLWATMYPSSQYIVALNSEDSLRTLAQQVPERAFVRTKIGDEDLALFRLAADEDGARGIMANFGFLQYLLLEGGYQLQYDNCGYYNQNFDKCFASQFLIYAAYDLIDIPARYCARMTVEGIHVNNPTRGYCGQSDGVVPYQNQVLRGLAASGFSPVVEYTVDRVSHVEQTRNPTVLTRIKTWLTTQNSLAPCGTGPVASLSLGSAPSGFYVDQVKPLSISSVDRCGVPTVPAPTILASSSNSGIVSVSIVSGTALYLNAIAPGSATITVQAGGFTATRAVTVLKRPVF